MYHHSFSSSSFSLPICAPTALPCPENSHFEECTSACPLTCTSIGLDGPCPLPCSEGCQCEEGFVLKDGRCIHKSDCGCLHRGRQLATNETFWTDWECQERCFCNGADNRVYCQIAPCHSEEFCQEDSALYFCQPRTEAVCIAAGYSHFLPFTGLPFELQTSCSLRLVTTSCGRDGDESREEDNNNGFPPFQLLARNEDRDTGQAIWVQGFVLEVYDYEIEISRNYKNTVVVSYQICLRKPIMLGFSLKFSVRSYQAKCFWKDQSVKTCISIAGCHLI